MEMDKQVAVGQWIIDVMLLPFLQDVGNYAGFDAEEFTSRSAGKASAVRHIKVSMSAAELHAYITAVVLLFVPSYVFHAQAHFGVKSLVMVGDGVTDVEARQPGGADLFVGYGSWRCQFPAQQTSQHAHAFVNMQT